MLAIKHFTIGAACAGLAVLWCSPAVQAQTRGVGAMTSAAVAAERRIIDAQAKRLAFNQSALRNYTANIQRARAEAAIRQQVQRAEAVARTEQMRVASQSLQQRFARVNNPGVVYLRYNPATGKHYVGRSKDTLGYLARQRSHDRAFRRAAAAEGSSISAPVSSQYMPIATASSHESLRVAEETAIRYYSSVPGISLSNARHEMSAASYSAATGGHVSVGASNQSLSSAFSAASGGSVGAPPSR